MQRRKDTPNIYLTYEVLCRRMRLFEINARYLSGNQTEIPFVEVDLCLQFWGDYLGGVWVLVGNLLPLFCCELRQTCGIFPFHLSTF